MSPVQPHFRMPVPVLALPFNQPELLSVPNHHGGLRRAKSWVETHLYITPTGASYSRSSFIHMEEISPVIERDTTKTVAWKVFRAALTVTKEVAGAIPFVQLGDVIGGLIAVLDMFEEADGNLEDIETITRHIKRIQTIVQPLKEDSTRLTDSLSVLVGNLERELVSLTTTAENRKNRSKLEQVVGTGSDASIIRQINHNFDRALQAFQTESILDIANKQEARAQDELVSSLPRAQNAGYDSGLRRIAGAVSCLEDTQKITLDEVQIWSDRIDSEGPPIFWVWGMAGTGKTTIAQTVAERQARQGRLVVSFFFSRDTKEQSDPLLLIPTLAYQLCHYSPVYKARLAKALQPNPDAISRSNIEHQLKTLIVDPLSACESFPSPIIIVIDALDECPEAVWESMVRAFGADVPRLEQKVKLLVTSRPETRLYSEVHSAPIRSYFQPCKLNEIDESIVSKDIKTYIDHHLRVIARKHELPDSWPDETQRDILVKKSGSLFIVAATLIKFIDDDTMGPKAELDALTNDTETLDVLGPKDALILMYTTIIDRALGSESSPKFFRKLELVKMVVGTIVLIKDPMSKSTLKAFLRNQNVSGALALFHSLISIPEKSGEPIRVLHQSFPEYLTNRDRCRRLFIDPVAGHVRLATLCLAHMEALERDPCKIGKLDRLNDEVPDLRRRIDKYIPLHIQYSCLRFTEHIVAASDPDERRRLAIAFATFCRDKLLVWIEVLSYLNRLDVAVSSIKQLREWYTDAPDASKEVTEIIDTTQSILDRFSHLIGRGAGHIYLTALPWASPCSPSSRYWALTGLPLHSTRESILQTLASRLEDQYHRTGDLSDLTEAICLERDALRCFPVAHPGRHFVVPNLARRLADRYRRARDADDLFPLIRLHREMLRHHTRGDPKRKSILEAVASHLVDSYQRSGKVTELAEAIRHHQESLESHGAGSGSHNTQSSIPTTRSITADDRSPKNGLHSHPPGHPTHESILLDIASCLTRRYHLTQHMGKIVEVMRPYAEATFYWHDSEIASRPRPVEEVTEDLRKAIILNYEEMGHARPTQSAIGRALHSSTRVLASAVTL